MERVSADLCHCRHILKRKLELEDDGHASDDLKRARRDSEEAPDTLERSGLHESILRQADEILEYEEVPDSYSEDDWLDDIEIPDSYSEADWLSSEEEPEHETISLTPPLLPLASPVRISIVDKANSTFSDPPLPSSPPFTL